MSDYPAGSWSSAPGAPTPPSSQPTAPPAPSYSSFSSAAPGAAPGSAPAPVPQVPNMAQPESSRPATSSLVPLSEIQTNQRGRMSTNIGGSKAVVLLPVAAEAGAGASSQRGPPQGVTHGVSFLPRPFVKKTSGVKWTAQEDALLRTAVEQHGAKNWKNIAAQLRDRTEVQCLHRWQKVLKPSLVKGPWTAEEDRK
ncbi:hypothetical protein TeGR_g12165, partial [Tetraparma gracilis]